MKLNETRPYLETSGQLEEQFFAIEDQGMIFDILRNKMYSNPILAICREISCNARDAHREVGASDVPIHIHLPNTLEPFYKVRDFGPGISPDRMSNIFIKYTASTKRSDNVQTGGFGLGAKTPFSYADTFTITTVHDGIKYNYNCVIDETKVGKLMLTGKSPTKEKNGTEIMIPVMPKNFSEFISNTEQSCRHWDVKPIIKGGTIKWQTMETVLSGTNWSIIKTSYDYNGYNRDARLIIDSIQYPVDLGALRKFADTALIDACQGSIVLYFGVGELSLSASREAIYLDEATQRRLKERLNEMRNELTQRTQIEMDKRENLWEANCYYNIDLRSTFNNIKFFNNLNWRGHKLTAGQLSLSSKSFTFSKGKYSRKHGTDPNKIYRSSSGNYVSFEPKVQLVVNDLPIKEPTPRHIKKSFDDNKDLKNLIVLTPPDKSTVEDFIKLLNLEEMGAILMSSLTKATGRAYVAPSMRVLVFKYDGEGSFRQTSYASLEEDTKRKVLFTLRKTSYSSYGSSQTRDAFFKNKSVGWAGLTALQAQHPEISFYGVDEDIPADRIERDFSDLEKFEDFCEKSLFKNPDINYSKLKAIISESNHSNAFNLDMRIASQIVPNLKNSNSFFIKFTTLTKEWLDIKKKFSSILDIYESIKGAVPDSDVKKFIADNPEYNIEAMGRKFWKKYEMLEYTGRYDYNPSKIAALTNYINLVDKDK